MELIFYLIVSDFCNESRMFLNPKPETDLARIIGFMHKDNT